MALSHCPGPAVLTSHPTASGRQAGPHRGHHREWCSHPCGHPGLESHEPVGPLAVPGGPPGVPFARLEDVPAQPPHTVSVAGSLLRRPCPSFLGTRSAPVLGVVGTQRCTANNGLHGGSLTPLLGTRQGRAQGVLGLLAFAPALGSCTASACHNRGICIGATGIEQGTSALRKQTFSYGVCLHRCLCVCGGRHPEGHPHHPHHPFFPHVSQASGPDRHGATTSLPRLRSPPSGGGSAARHGPAQGRLGHNKDLHSTILRCPCHGFRDF